MPRAAMETTFSFLVVILEPRQNYTEISIESVVTVSLAACPQVAAQTGAAFATCTKLVGQVMAIGGDCGVPKAKLVRPRNGARGTARLLTQLLLLILSVVIVR